MSRRAARVDANHAEVVKALRKAGCSVASLASVGAGIPDLVVGIRGVNLLLEIKDGSKPPSARQLTDDEKAFMTAWRGQYAVVESAEQAVGVVMAAGEAQ